jgi:hypothetical protein
MLFTLFDVKKILSYWMTIVDKNKVQECGTHFETFRGGT